MFDKIAFSQSTSDIILFTVSSSACINDCPISDAREENCMMKHHRSLKIKFRGGVK